MQHDTLESDYNHDTDTGIKYKVFYSDSEDVAKFLAVSHIKATIYDNEQRIERPTIEFSVWIRGAIIPSILNILISISIVLLHNTIYKWICIVAYFAVFFVTVKYFVILTVLLYQKYAPERIRCSCCFEPSCSNYMLQAIEKYGFGRGFIKGIKRLLRCHYPNGGIDCP